MIEIKKDLIEKFIYSTKVKGNTNFHIKPKTIYEFLAEGSSKIKKIPSYQRPYSWESSHLNDFLNDIVEVSDIQNTTKETWFLGSIYTTQQSSSDKTSYILDGQQRITSLQIILNEIKLARFYDDTLEFNDFDDIIENLNDCLLYNDSGTKKPKFITDSITNQFISHYITDSRNIKTAEKYNEFFDKFKSNLDQKTDESLSVKTLYENINRTKDFLLKNVLNNEELCGKTGQKLKPSEKLKNFANSILYHFWLIEIPLIEEAVSTQIFEGLNNRGKPLSLVDKLQFLSLTSDIDNKEKIKSGWGSIYKLIDKLNKKNRKKVFKSDEDFLKSFFLSKKGSELEDDNDYILFFKNNYLKNQKTLNTFFQKLKTIITFFIEIESTDSSFINFFSDKKEKNKITAILYVLNELIFEYKNTTILLLKVFDTTEISEQNKYIIIQCIWSIIQLSVVENIFDGKSPNQVRNNFLSLNKSLEEKDFTNLIHFIKQKNEKIENHTDDEIDQYELSCISINEGKKNFSYQMKKLNDSSNLLNTKKNSDATIVLYLYILITQHEKFNIYSKKEKESSHLEHIFPRAWKNFWSEKQYDSSEAINHLNKKGKFKDLLSDESIEFELKDYISQPYKQNESLIEWIGNKIILNGSKNKGASNKSFIDKYNDYYTEQNKIMLPSNDSGELYFDEKTDFDYKKIIDRSIVIVEKLSIQFLNMGWDEIK